MFTPPLNDDCFFGLVTKDARTYKGRCLPGTALTTLTYYSKVISKVKLQMVTLAESDGSGIQADKLKRGSPKPKESQEAVPKLTSPHLYLILCRNLLTISDARTASLLLRLAPTHSCYSDYLKGIRTNYIYR